MHSIPYVYPTPDGEWILGQSLDNQVWRRATWGGGDEPMNSHVDLQILTYAAKDRFKLNKKKRFAGHVNAGHACGISMSPDMRYVLSGDVDGQVRLTVLHCETSEICSFGYGSGIALAL